MRISPGAVHRLVIDPEHSIAMTVPSCNRERRNRTAKQ
jgi:hypothetical protein